MAALATSDDLQARITRTLDVAEDGADTARVTAILDDASAAVRLFVNQQIDQAETTDRLPVRIDQRGQYVRLPERPVVEVAEVTDINGNTVTTEWDGHTRLAITGRTGSTFATNLDPDLGWVDVTYTHGYDTENDPRGKLAIVAGVVANIAARAFGTPAEETGKTAESIAGYSYQIGGAAAAGGFGLLRSEERTLEQLFGKRRAGTIPL